MHGEKPTIIDAGIYGFIANVFFYDIDTPHKQFVVSAGNMVRHCRAMKWSRLSEQIFRVDKWSLCRG